ncbi:hypothetical protein J2W46_005762 [Paraburkholderia strydomiana]|nr:hypothetical protein [Paraburkholderia strydomiana]
MDGLVEEGQEQIAEIENGPVLDTARIASAQKVEHYEIASYGSLIALAKRLGETAAVELLHCDPWRLASHGVATDGRRALHEAERPTDTPMM